MTAPRPALSVVVPAFDEADRLPRTLPVLAAHLATWPGGAELLVVDDGSTDDTVGVAERLLADVATARVVRLGAHRGKGAAVRRGLRDATGEAVVFLDADLATDLDDVAKVVVALDGADLAIGSRSIAGADASWRHRGERLRHALFGRTARRITGVPVGDFQCGCKALRAEAAALVADRAREDGFAFDVELLVLARRDGLRIVEVPVRWRAQDGGHVRVVRDAPTMLWRTFAIRRRLGRPPR